VTPQIRHPLPPNAAMRYAVITRIVARLRPATVLEIGCGQGAFGARLAAGRRYLGVEPDQRSYRVAEQRIRPAGGEVRNCDHTALAKDSQYDLVCAFEVIEHLEDDKAAMADWAGLVRPGGHLLLSTPGSPERYGPWDKLVGHYRRYSRADLSGLLLSAGLVDPEVIGYNWPLGAPLEAIRNRIAGRRLATAAPATPEEGTAGSGRILQPRRLAGLVVAAGVAPFAQLQRLVPDRGIGLIALARRPAETGSEQDPA
jgi:SAM-dependent methyltransferase